jgi:hypothetical protein
MLSLGGGITNIAATINIRSSPTASICSLAVLFAPHLKGARWQLDQNLVTEQTKEFA